MAVFTIARLTFKEAARRRILLAALALGLVFLIVFGVGLHLIFSEFEARSIDPNGLQRSETGGFLFSAGLYVANFLVTMMTVLTSVDSVAHSDLALGIASSVQAVVIAVPLGRASLSAVRDVAEAVGRERVLGAVTIRGG